MTEKIAKHSAESVEHYTPPWIVEGARRVMGGIDLDPATSLQVNSLTVKAASCYTQEDDGLVHTWTGRVFLNPPGGKIGGKSNAAIWWAKLIESYELGTVTEAVFVAYSLELFQTAQRRDTVAPYMFPFCVPRVRVKYFIKQGDALVEGGCPPNASAIVYLPPEDDSTSTQLFHTVFNEYGAVRT